MVVVVEVEVVVLVVVVVIIVDVIVVIVVIVVAVKGKPLFPWRHPPCCRPGSAIPPQYSTCLQLGYIPPVPRCP